MGLYIGNTRYCPVIGIVKALPYDAEIEYLESTGTQAIDTGIRTWNTLVSVYTEMAFTNLTDARKLEGAVNAFTYGLNDGKYELAYQAYYGTADTNFFTFQKTLVRSNSSNQIMENVWINDVNCRNATYANGYPTAITTNIFMFAVSSTGSFGLKCRKKSYRLVIDNLMVRDFIPVRVGQVGYMYDKVSGQLFGNANSTDAFILGPDIT